MTKKEGDPMRKHLAIKILSLFIALLLIVGSAHAALSPQKANLAWERISKAAGLKTDPITIEDKKEPNAWVRFSGDSYSVHVTTGLLKILDTEDQIAGILAHETGHIKLNHYGSTVGRNLLWSLLYKSLKGNQSNELLAGLGITLAESGFSREQEVEADDYGIKLSVEAGYSAWGLVQALEKMKEAGYETSPSGFNSHPPTERRLEHARATARAYSQK
ncbi:MAG: M48 family metallopeptidase [Aminobacterium colombiense]|nr:M48 family metallopeptidase [Aminobacterium colombiense]